LNTWYRDHVAELGIINFVYCEERKTGGFLGMSGILVVDRLPLILVFRALHLSH
jgi:hypothetical protein